MKVAVAILLLAYACRTAQVETQAVPAAVLPAEPTAQLAFDKDIQPILQSHCSPCHFKDGKMYERMPFDQSKTLVDFQEGILRRLKNEEELAKVRAYLGQLEQASN